MRVRHSNGERDNALFVRLSMQASCLTRARTGSGAAPHRELRGQAALLSVRSGASLHDEMRELPRFHFERLDARRPAGRDAPDQPGHVVAQGTHDLQALQVMGLFLGPAAMGWRSSTGTTPPAFC